MKPDDDKLMELEENFLKSSQDQQQKMLRSFEANPRIGKVRFTENCHAPLESRSDADFKINALLGDYLKIFQSPPDDPFITWTLPNLGHLQKDDLLDRSWRHIPQRNEENVYSSQLQLLKSHHKLFKRSFKKTYPITEDGKKGFAGRTTELIP